jgi:hypothetical protein
MAATLAEVIQALTACQANPQERTVFTDRERLDNLDDFAELTTKDITDLASKFGRRTVADGRIIIPAKVLKNIQALCFWARDKVRAGQPLVGFTPAELTSVKETMRLRQEDSGTTPSIKPDKFDPAKWRDYRPHTAPFCLLVNLILLVLYHA